MDASSNPQPPRLLDQVKQVMRLKHYSLRTEESYIYYIRQYILFHNKRHPREMGVDEIRAYLSHLAVEKNVAASTQNVALSALLFLYQQVFKVELPYIGNIERAQKPAKLPVVFTRSEVKLVLSHLHGIHHLLASLLYGSGLRLSECLRLRVKDLDFEYRQITVRDGKGEVDRKTMLPEGMVPIVEPETVITFDTPAGLVKSHARIEGHQVAEVSVVNVPSFLYARDIPLQLPGLDAVMIDIAFGGNFFALLPATALHIALQPDHLPQLIRLGMMVKQAANAVLSIQHPTARQIRTVELVEIYDHPDPSKPWTKNIVIFGNGQVDRCPCGTGTSAMMATLYARGELPLGVEWISEGMIGTQFKGQLLQETQVGDFAAVVPLITGSAYLTGIQQFVLDPNDPLNDGFVLGE